MLIAIAAPAAACEKAARTRIAGTQAESQTAEATFTGEFVNGTPVYRLPTITVVSRRPAEVAKTQPDGAQPHAIRSRHGPQAAAPVPTRRVASASQEAIADARCAG